MGRLYLTFEGTKMCHTGALAEVESLGGVLKFQRSGIEIKETEACAPLVNLIIDYGKNIFIGVLSAWIYDKLKSGGDEMKVSHQNNYIFIGKVDINITKEDSIEEIEEKLKKISKLPEKK